MSIATGMPVSCRETFTGPVEKELISQSRAVRVLHVIPQLGTGGAERVVLDLMRSVDAERFVSTLCVLGPDVARSRANRLPGGTEFLGYRGSLRDVPGLTRCVRGLRRLIRQSGAKIVHSHLWPAARIASLACIGTDARHIVHVHDAWPWVRGSSVRNRLMRLATWWTVRRSRPTFVCVGRAVQEQNLPALGLDDLPYVVVPNGVDTSAFRPATKAHAAGDILRVGMVARVVPEKGFAELLHAAAALTSQGLRVELHFAGDGTHLERFRAMGTSLGIGELVHFHGLVAEVAEFLRGLDVFVLPSHAEGMPLTVLEAMASGLPVVATSVGAIPEVIGDERTGLLVPPEDVDALMRAIGRLAADAGLRETLGSAAAKAARESFSFEAVANEVERLYDSLTLRSEST